MSSSKNQTANGPTPLLDSSSLMPEPIARVIEVFQRDLTDVTFPDVSLAALEQAAENVRERAADLEVLRKRVAAAQAELGSAKLELESLAERGLAYAKVYATGQVELSSKLAKLNVADPPKRKRRKSSKAERASEASSPAASRGTDDDDMPTRSLLSAVG